MDMQNFYTKTCYTAIVDNMVGKILRVFFIRKLYTYCKKDKYKSKQQGLCSFKVYTLNSQEFCISIYFLFPIIGINYCQYCQY